MLNNIIKITLIIFMAIFVPSFAGALEKTFFTGSVLDVKGNAVRGAEIYLYDSPDTRRDADFISAETDAEGRFGIELPKGKYWAVARVRHGEKYGPLMPGDRHSGEAVEIEVERPGSFEQNFIVMNLIESAGLIQKTRDGYFVIKGRIVDKSGVPVSNVYVFANRGMDMRQIPDYISAWSNEKGKYRLYMPEGRYYVGYATEFPLILKSRMLVEVEVDNDREGFNIIADSVIEKVQQDQ
jgi:hypothetical protein